MHGGSKQQTVSIYNQQNSRLTDSPHRHTDTQEHTQELSQEKNAK